MSIAEFYGTPPPPFLCPFSSPCRSARLLLAAPLVVCVSSVLLSLPRTMMMASQRDKSCVAWLSSLVVSSCLVAMMVLALFVGDAAAVSYTLRASDSIVGTGVQAQGIYVSMSSNGMVSLSVSNSATNGPVLAVASSPGATTTHTSLSLPSPCTAWLGNAPSVSSSGNTFSVSCRDASAINYVAVYQTSSPSTPFATIANVQFAALSEDGAMLAAVDGFTITVYQLSMGSYALKQTIAVLGLQPIGTITLAPDASALAVSDQMSQTFIYGWDSTTSQFVAAPSIPLSVGCNALAASSQSSSGATTIVCAFGPSRVYSLVNTMGSLSLSTQATISGFAKAAAITPDGSTVALSDGSSSTAVYSATSGSTIATFSEGGRSVAISSDAATVFLGDFSFNSNAGRAVWYDSLVAPSITLQPMSVSVSLGSSATFTAAATGYATVQWSFTGSSTRRRSVLGGAIMGATLPSFTTNPTTLAFNGNTYSATFTSAAGVTTTTLAATLTVTSSSGSASGDPHLVGFDGQQYDFVGEVGSVYNFLTDSEVQFNALLGSVRATEHLNLPGEFITAIGIKFRNHSVVIDGGSHRRAGSVTIDHRPADQQNHHAVLMVDGELRVEREVFVDAMSGEDFGLPDAKQRIVGRVIVTTPSFSFSIFMVEEGFDEVDKRWHTPFPRRFLDVSVRLERADIATPHGVLGQSLHAMRDRKERGVPIGEAGSFSIEGRTEDYRVGGGAESLLRNSFAFNRFGSKSRK